MSIKSTAPSAHAFVMQQLQKATPGVVSFLLFPVPFSALELTIERKLGQAGNVKLKQVAFAVYDQLLVSVPKLRFPQPETFPSAPSIASLAGPPTRLFQGPSFTLSPHRQTPVQFEYSWPSHNLEILHRHRFLHVAYRLVHDPTGCATQSDDANTSNEWLFVAVIDEKGEMWKVFNKVFRNTQTLAEGDLVKSVVRTVWSYARMVASTVDVEWRLAICKAGLLAKDETHGARPGFRRVKVPMLTCLMQLGSPSCENRSRPLAKRSTFPSSVPTALSMVRLACRSCLLRRHRSSSIPSSKSATTTLATSTRARIGLPFRLPTSSQFKSTTSFGLPARRSQQAQLRSPRRVWPTFRASHRSHTRFALCLLACRP